MPLVRVGVPDTQTQLTTRDKQRRQHCANRIRYIQPAISGLPPLGATASAHTRPIEFRDPATGRSCDAPLPHRQRIAPCRAQSHRLRTLRRGVLLHGHPQRAPPERAHPQEREAHRARHGPCQCHAPLTRHRRASDQLIRTSSGHPSGRQSWGRRSCNRDRRHRTQASWPQRGRRSRVSSSQCQAAPRVPSPTHGWW